MKSENFITLVIHTSNRAEHLKMVLESHDLKVELEDLEIKCENFSEPPKKVRIEPKDLPLALKILESGDLVSSPVSAAKLQGVGNTLLIPVDFSPYSMLAVRVGFYLAKKFEIEPVILHSFIAPAFTPSDYYDSQADAIEIPEVDEIEEQIDLSKIASQQLSKFKHEIEQGIKDGRITDVKFSTTLLEGVPEQVIQEYCRENRPMLVVMSTRDVEKKESDLIGSVTAEVIDSCRVPILTIPENYEPVGVENLKRIAFFCNFTPYDLVTLRGLMRSFNYPACDIWLIPVSESQVSDVDSKLSKLGRYLTDIYPTAHFHTSRINKGKFDENMRKLLNDNDISMIIVPNKKSNAISRFFRPTLAHKILFEKNLPLLVIPV